jgi:hypothetical protein
MLAGSGRRLGRGGRLKEWIGVPLIKKAFIIVKYICMAYAVEYSLKSLRLLNYRLDIWHLTNTAVSIPYLCILSLLSKPLSSLGRNSAVRTRH